MAPWSIIVPSRGQWRLTIPEPGPPLATASASGIVSSIAAGVLLGHGTKFITRGRIRSAAADDVIPQHVCLGLQVVQPALHHVAYADDAAEFAAVEHGQVADPVTRHLRHHILDI